MFLLSPDFWAIRKTRNRGRGVFAKKDIFPGTVIGDFLGTLVTNARADRDERRRGVLYAMEYTSDVCIMPNPKKPGVHFLNTSCAPNCDAYPYRGHVLIFALRRIFKGEELTTSYFLDPPEPECPQCNHVCRCGTPVCRGTMHVSREAAEKSEHFVRKLEKRLRPLPRRKTGEELQKLLKYPANILDYRIYDLFGATMKSPLNCPDPKLPHMAALRGLIRHTGRRLRFYKLGCTVYGIMNDLVILKR